MNAAAFMGACQVLLGADEFENMTERVLAVSDEDREDSDNED